MEIIKANHPFYLALSLVFIFLHLSCSSGYPEGEIKDLKQQLTELQRANADLGIQVGEINNTILVLKERTKDIEVSLKRLMRRKERPLEVVKVIPERVEPSPPPLPSNVEGKGGSHPVRSGKKNLVDKSRPKRQSADEEDNNEPPLVNPLLLYKESFEKFDKGDYEEAARGFKRLVETAPTHEYVDNALYWLAETYYLRQDYIKAIEYLLQLIREYPYGNKVPEALLKIGLSYIRLGKEVEAGRYLKEVIEKYPFSFAANKAQKWLEEIGSTPP